MSGRGSRRADVRARALRVAAAAAVGGGAFLLSLWLWPVPAGSAGWLVERYEQLSIDPFRRSGYSHRILAPALAHVLGLGGERFRLVTLAFSPILLAGVYLYCRRAELAPAASAAVVVAIAISRTVGNSNLTPGLTDTVTYALLLASLAAVRRPVWFWSLVLLNLLNHEQAAFVLPWLLYVRHAAGGLRPRLDAALGALALGLYALFRSQLDPGVLGLHAQYLRRPALDYVMEILLAWWFFWTSFGLLLVCLWAYAASSRVALKSTLTCLAGAAATYVPAWDPPRYSHLAFGVVVIACIEFLQVEGRLRWFLAMLLCNAGIYLASRWGMERFVQHAREACAGAPDPERCIHLQTMWLTAPSLLVLPAVRWLARRVRAAPERAGAAVPEPV